MGVDLSGVKRQVWPNQELTDGRFDLIHERFLYMYMSVLRICIKVTRQLQVQEFSDSMGKSSAQNYAH